ncbi:MAG: hypothetical protein QXD89_00550 [Candidatus Aenigmatarchaeota archaeon]
MKGEFSFFIKVLSIVIFSSLIFFTIQQVLNFQKIVSREKEISELKNQALNILQKLITDKNCLAYEENNTFKKAVIDLNKLEDFTKKYSNIEPECAKALGFDYTITVKQIPYEFSIYPGEIILTYQTMLFYVGPDLKCGRLGKMNTNGECEKISTAVCNFNPAEYEDLCSNIHGDAPTCSNECWPDPYEKCSYPTHKLCCFYILCPAKECEFITSSSCTGAHGGTCYFWKCNVSNCIKIGNFDVHCTRWIIEKPIPSIQYTQVNIPTRIWNVSLKMGLESFSPEKAKKSELTISFPVIIRYNTTFSTQGIIEMYVVKGELEEFYSLIEDICEKAKENPEASITFSKEFYFSYPVRIENKIIYMLNSYKILECPFDINLKRQIEEGEHIINFIYNSTEKVIKVYED